MDGRAPFEVFANIRWHFLCVGTVDDIRRRMSEVEQKLHPEYFLWICDRGYLPIAEVKRQLELFGTRVMNDFKG
jgi:hypothetical protein